MTLVAWADGVEKCPIAVDGRLDDPGWRNALVWTVGNTRVSNDRLTIRVTYDEDSLYFSADVTDSNVRGAAGAPRIAALRDDAIAFYFEVDRARAKDRTPRTFEYAFSPAGGFSSSRGNGKGDGSNYPGYVWPPSFRSKVEYKTVLKTGTTLNDGADRDRGFIVEARVPWSEWHVRGADMIGRSMGFNVIKICRPEQRAPKETPLSLASGITFANEHNPSLWRNVYLFHPSRLVPQPREQIKRATSQTYGRDQRIVGTHYFYWYRWPDQHFWDDASWTDDGQQDHYPMPERVSFDSPAWHEQELRDVMMAGIDFILPVYWGAPDHYLSEPIAFSVLGLPPMVEALDRLTAAGKKPPRVGLFYDTSTLLTGVRALREPGTVLDLTTDHGRKIFYRTIRDFFIMIPPRHWATIEGKPIVVLYATFGAQHDQRLFDHVYRHFEEEFGCRPYIVRNSDWRAHTEAVTSWGAALSGAMMPGEPRPGAVVQIGPGYDDRAVPGRTTPVRPRDNGGFYEASWHRAARSGRHIVLIETWNEMHEGTDICHSREYGRQYIDLTYTRAQAFKRGAPLPPLNYEPSDIDKARTDLGKEFATAEAVSYQPGREAGLYPTADQADGQSRAVVIGGVKALRTVANTVSDCRYLYFRVADAYAFNVKKPIEITVEYFDEGKGAFSLQYDSRDVDATQLGAYKDGQAVELSGTGTWKTATWRLTDARLANRQNGQSDFRLFVGGQDLAVRRIVLKKAGTR